MQFNVPYIPDDEYTTFLTGLGDTLHSVHFSLYNPLLNDGRVRMGAVDAEYLAGQLVRLQAPRKYVLANGRFHLPDQYLRQDRLELLAGQLLVLEEAGALDGIVFSDAYLLLALAKQSPQLVARLEAIPSINFVIDSIEKTITLLRLTEQCGLLPPDKLPLDRELNRQPGRLKHLVSQIRTRFPAVKIELLANEGCLAHCPFRATHEALIAAVNNGTTIDTLQINRQLGCVHSLMHEPYRVLSSPVILPEDVHRYDGVADIIKICGRSLGKEFLMRTIQSYMTRVSPENFLSLLDAAHWMAQHWQLDVKKMPEDVYQRLIGGCSGDCRNCTVCRELFTGVATELPLQLKDLRTR